VTADPRLLAQISEEALLERVRRLARLTGWHLYHTRDSRRSEPGFPDLLLVHPDSPIALAVELKRERGRLSAAQTRWLALLAGRRLRVGVWRPSHWDQIEAILIRPELLAAPLRIAALDDPMEEQR
jgi:hypothetical protein